MRHFVPWFCSGCLSTKFPLSGRYTLMLLISSVVCLFVFSSMFPSFLVSCLVFNWLELSAKLRWVLAVLPLMDDWVLQTDGRYPHIHTDGCGHRGSEALPSTLSLSYLILRAMIIYYIIRFLYVALALLLPLCFLCLFSSFLKRPSPLMRPFVRLSKARYRVLFGPGISPAALEGQRSFPSQILSL